MRGPKRATKIRKLFNLTKEDDVRKYVNTYRRSFVSATGTFSLLEKLLWKMTCIEMTADIFLQVGVWACLFVVAVLLTLGWHQVRRGARHPRSRGS
jgi:hypothetical protein